MKKCSIIALVLLICLSLAACGRRKDDTDMTILPSMDPTIGTNIPDPEIDTKLPIYTDGTDATDWVNPDMGNSMTSGRTSVE
jgi:hypothetical protein